ncbi:F-box/kelch-repeat protein At3g23880-like [Papaver somniferum]|uniref:F-box/kelch-repeat protein At3g23880-like n=1 Tax=Papaver somniferum TaxID=3469 RepID=UPI000E702144|nr:F-box/kelch-repeat protein At3g23880-like [Papaver somniferum]
MGGDCVLPQDLLIEILLWLPVISLLRFKTVCKLWRATIEGSDFIYRHATFENSSDKIGNFIFQSRHRPFFYNFKPHFFSLSPSSSRGEREWVYKYIGVPPHLAEAEAEAEAEDLDQEELPFKVTLAGSCHGILCLHEVEPRDIILWNPATKKFRRLPKSLPFLDETLRFCYDYVGFGFDIETHDYKVFQSTTFQSDSDHLTETRVQVYSLHSNSRRWCTDLRTFPSYNHNKNQGRYLNGCFYLLGNNFYRKEVIENSKLWKYTDSEQVILSFDFSKESFRMIPAPAPCLTWLYVIGGNHGKIVCLNYSHSGDIDTHQIYELNATMIEENKEYSWSKLYTTTRDRCRSFNGPLEITRNGVFGFIDCFSNGRMMLFNLLTEEIFDIEINDTSLEGEFVIQTDVYRESLVSV